MDHFYILFGEISIQIICSFLTGFFKITEFWVIFLYSRYRYVICKNFFTSYVDIFSRSSCMLKHNIFNFDEIQHIYFFYFVACVFGVKHLSFLKRKARIWFLHVSSVYRNNAEILVWLQLDPNGDSGAIGRVHHSLYGTNRFLVSRSWFSEYLSSAGVKTAFW